MLCSTAILMLQAGGLSNMNVIITDWPQQLDTGIAAPVKQLYAEPHCVSGALAELETYAALMMFTAPLLKASNRLWPVYLGLHPINKDCQGVISIWCG